MRDCGETQYCPDTIHFFEVPDDSAIVFFSIFFEENQCQQLMLSVIFSRIFTGIQGESSGLDKGICVFDKTDKPAGRSLICLLTRQQHNIVRRHCTLDLLVVFYSVSLREEIISTEHKFLEGCEVRDGRETQYSPDAIHLFEVPDNRTIIFFPVFFEKEKCQQLMLGEISSRIFAGIRGDPGRLYDCEGMFNKTDKPSRRFLNCLLTGYQHNIVRRHCTLDLSVDYDSFFISEKMISTEQNFFLARERSRFLFMKQIRVLCREFLRNRISRDSDTGFFNGTLNWIIDERKDRSILIIHRTSQALPRS